MLRQREASALIYLATNGTAFPVAMFSAAYAGNSLGAVMEIASEPAPRNALEAVA